MTKPTNSRLAKLFAAAAIAPFFLMLFAVPVLEAKTATAKPPVKIDALGKLNEVAGGAGYGANPVSPVAIVGNVIGYALTLLGVIFTILVIYAGFLWMTAQGNEEQISKAKKLLMNAVIGLIILMSAYAISSFVIAAIDAGSKAPAQPTAPAGT